MLSHTIKISASNASQAQKARELVSEIAKSHGGQSEDAANGLETKHILETSAVIEMLIGIPVGVSIGLLANEVHRRILAASKKSDHITLEQQGEMIIITHNETGLRITIAETKSESGEE